MFFGLWTEGIATFMTIDIRPENGLLHVPVFHDLRQTAVPTYTRNCYAKKVTNDRRFNTSADVSKFKILPFHV